MTVVRHWSRGPETGGLSISGDIENSTGKFLKHYLPLNLPNFKVRSVWSRRLE